MATAEVRKGDNIWINRNGLSSFSTSLATKLKKKFAAKQDQLTAGDGIEIDSDNVISSNDFVMINFLTSSARYDTEDDLISALGIDPRQYNPLKHDYGIVISDSSVFICYKLFSCYSYGTSGDDNGFQCIMRFMNESGYIIQYLCTMIDNVSGYAIEVETTSMSVTVDSALSSTSTNPVQNKVINSALSSKANTSALPTYTKVTASAAYTVPANATTVEKVYQITMGSTAYDITAASGVTWLNGEAPTTQANKTYVVSIINNLAVWGEFATV